MNFACSDTHNPNPIRITTPESDIQAVTINFDIK